MKDPIGPMTAIVALVGACSLCALGPTFFLSITAAAIGWLANLEPVMVIGLSLLVAFVLSLIWAAWGARDTARRADGKGEVS